MTWNPNEGQVPPESECGQWLTKLAAQSHVIVESGPYYGLGTTRCLAAGLICPEQTIYSAEPAPDAYAACVERYKDEKRIVFHNGRLIDWRGNLPEKIDLLVLDGGDYDSAEEFFMFKDRCHWIVMDDTTPPAIKNIIPRKYCIENQWRFLADSTTGHKGWCVVENPNWQTRGRE